MSEADTSPSEPEAADLIPQETAAAAAAAAAVPPRAHDDDEPSSTSTPTSSPAAAAAADPPSAQQEDPAVPDASSSPAHPDHLTLPSDAEDDEFDGSIERSTTIEGPHHLKLLISPSNARRDSTFVKDDVVVIEDPETHTRIVVEHPDESERDEADPVTKREIRAWYCYDFANSVFSSVSVVAFFPLLLTEMADHAADDDGFVHVGSIPFRPASFATAMISFSVVLQAFAFVSSGAFADFGNLRLTLLKVTAVAGSTVTMLVVFFADEETWLAVGILAMLSNVLFGMSIVYYNAFLPKLVQAHPDVVSAKHAGQTREDVHRLEEDLANRLSTHGYAAGYASGVLLLIIAIGVQFALPATGTHTVTARDSDKLVTFDSDLLSQKDTFEHTFRYPGTFAYFDRDPDSDHTQVLVEGVVVVKDLPTTLRRANATNATYNGFAAAPIDQSSLKNPVYITYGYHHPPGLKNVTTILAGETVQWNLDQGGDTTTGPRLAVFMSGIWWFLFSLYTFKYLHPRPGPPLPAEASSNYLAFSWVRVFRTLSMARQFPNTIRFLVAYFVFSDGYTTISTVGVLFGREELGMTSGELGLLALIVPLFALFGNYMFIAIQNKFALESKSMVIMNLAIMAVLPLYGFLGFIEGLPIGLKAPWELYVFALVYGLNLGSVQSYARVVFSELIPMGKESELFSLFEITDKGSSWMGSLLISLVFNATNSMRYGLFYLIIFLLGPIPLILKVDVLEGKLQARGFTMKVEEAQQEVVARHMSITGTPAGSLRRKSQSARPSMTAAHDSKSASGALSEQRDGPPILDNLVEVKPSDRSGAEHSSSSSGVAAVELAPAGKKPGLDEPRGSRTKAVV